MRHPDWRPGLVGGECCRALVHWHCHNPAIPTSSHCRHCMQARRQRSAAAGGGRRSGRCAARSARRADPRPARACARRACLCQPAHGMLCRAGGACEPGGRVCRLDRIPLECSQGRAVCSCLPNQDFKSRRRAPLAPCCAKRLCRMPAGWMPSARRLSALPMRACMPCCPPCWRWLLRLPAACPGWVTGWVGWVPLVSVRGSWFNPLDPMQLLS